MKNYTLAVAVLLFGSWCTYAAEQPEGEKDKGSPESGGVVTKVLTTTLILEPNKEGLAELEERRRQQQKVEKKVDQDKDTKPPGTK